jgi:hypothetical protein
MGVLFSGVNINQDQSIINQIKPDKPPTTATTTTTTKPASLHHPPLRSRSRSPATNKIKIHPRPKTTSPCKIRRASSHYFYNTSRIIFALLQNHEDAPR